MGSIADSSNLSPQTGIDRLKAIQEIAESSVGAASTDLRKVIKHVCDILYNRFHLYMLTSVQIYDNPEIAFEEYIAHDTICKYLEDQGFQVTRKAYGVETAFEVLYGQGGRLVSINAEYDALPGIGHGCGHHLIAASSIAAFLGVTAAIKQNGIEGRVQLLGCPAEENQGGKAVLCNAGALKGVDAAVMA
jgi:metal-dependent amidase/aminoacylase/carboxypeptidase family protein